MKTTFYYDQMNVPNQVRIKSEKLCLDHVFSPDAMVYDDVVFNFTDLIILLNNSLFKIYIKCDNGSLMIKNPDGSLSNITGWIYLDPSEIQLRPLSDLYHLTPMKDKNKTNKRNSLHNSVKTIFNCPIALRDELENLINENREYCSPDEIMIMLLTKALASDSPLS